MKFTLSILETGVGTKQEAYEREEHYIGVELIKSFDAVLNRNLTPSKPGFNPSHPETRTKMRAQAALRWANPEQHEHASKVAREASNRPERLEHMRTDNPVKYITPEKRAEITRKITGKKRSEESKQRYRDSWTPERRAAHAARTSERMKQWWAKRKKKDE